jgi:hypothetical protein
LLECIRVAALSNLIELFLALSICVVGTCVSTNILVLSWKRKINPVFMKITPDFNFGFRIAILNEVDF